MEGCVRHGFALRAQAAQPEHFPLFSSPAPAGTSATRDVHHPPPHQTARRRHDRRGDARVRPRAGRAPPAVGLTRPRDAGAERRCGRCRGVRWLRAGGGRRRRRERRRARGRHRRGALREPERPARRRHRLRGLRPQRRPVARPGQARQRRLPDRRGVAARPPRLVGRRRRRCERRRARRRRGGRARRRQQRAQRVGVRVRDLRTPFDGRRRHAQPRFERLPHRRPHRQPARHLGGRRARRERRWPP